MASGKGGGEVATGAGCGGEAERGDDEDEYGFEDGEDELEVAGLFDAEIVQSGDEPGDADGEDLRPEQRSAARCGR